VGQGRPGEGATCCGESKAKNVRVASACESRRCWWSGGNTLKPQRRYEQERTDGEWHERMSGRWQHRRSTPDQAAERHRGEKTQEGNGSARDEILPLARTDSGRTKALGARPAMSAASFRRRKRDGRENAEREAPGDEPGSSLLEGKTLKGRNPMSVSGTKQDRRAR
jgi:hypothetical protein